MTETTNNYDQRGVSSSKEDVHDAIKNLDKGIAPKAFCKILPDQAGDPDHCTIMHADGAGTKSALAYLYWKETADLSVWKGIAQDALVMNLDDLLCIGVTRSDYPLYLSTTIGRNKALIPGTVIGALINGMEENLESVRKHAGIAIHSAGGETADVGDLVRTIIVDCTLVARMRRSDLITVEPKPGDLIVGLSSFGKADYEEEYNSGMGSNGLTSARHDLFDGTYRKYPESFCPQIDPGLVYQGESLLTQKVSDAYFDTNKGRFVLSHTDMGRFVLSPTRTYAPIIKEALESCERDAIHGIVHCSGGGQTKVMNYVEGLHVIKDHLFPTPLLFRLIQRESGTSWQEMYKVFNMGHRMEVFCDIDAARAIIETAESHQVEAKVIGHFEEYSGKKLTIVSEHGTFTY
jgi:phosphoribosylformylglycinamidine cyclo-ligase